MVFGNTIHNYIEYHSVPLTSSMVHLPVSMIHEWYLERPFITIEYTFSTSDFLIGKLTSLNDTYMAIGNSIHTIEYHSVPLTSSMVLMSVAMIPEWYLEIPFITIEYHIRPTDVLNGRAYSCMPVAMIPGRIVFGNTIHNY